MNTAKENRKVISTNRNSLNSVAAVEHKTATRNLESKDRRLFGLELTRSGGCGFRFRAGKSCVTVENNL